MSGAIDLTGQYFGKLRVVSFAGRDLSGNRQWLCKCECGNETVRTTKSLRAGNSTSCGCTTMADVTGQRFGKLVALRPTTERRGKGVRWECLCDCGNRCIVNVSALKSGNTQSCGCSLVNDLTGQRFGRLLVLHRVASEPRNPRWRCLCDCGNEFTTSSDELTRGHTKSCGCFKAEVGARNLFVHGLSRTRVYNIWKSMRRRCTDSNSEVYQFYGGVGISVCPEWQDPVVFYSWAMSHGYKDSLSLDRVNPFRDYCPENCQWATDKQQGINKRTGYFYAVRRGYELNVDKYVSRHNRQFVRDFLEIIFTRKYWSGVFRKCNYTLNEESAAEELYEFVYGYVALYLCFLDWAFDTYTGETTEPFVVKEVFPLMKDDPKPDTTYEGFLRDLQYCFDSLKKEDVQGD